MDDLTLERRLEAKDKLIAELVEAGEQAFDILTNIPEDLDSWENTNSAIQEAHDILDEAIRKHKGD